MAWLPVVTTVAPTAEPVTLGEAKAQCRVDDTASDGEIAGFIAAARAHIEGITGTRLASQTVAMRCDSFADLAALPVAPVTTITSIIYIDDDGESTTLAGSVYEARLYGLRPGIVLAYNQDWPGIREGSLITVTATVGYALLSNECPDLYQALKLTIAHMYDRRDLNDANYARALASLLGNRRIYSV